MRLNTVPGIDEMRSTSSRGSSNITLTFNLEKNPDQAYQEVQQKLSTVVNRLPDDADPPVARKSDPDSTPVLMYSVSAPRDIVELTDLVTTLIQEKIESADGVGEVVVFGGRDEADQALHRSGQASGIRPVDHAGHGCGHGPEPGAARRNAVEGSQTVGLRTMSKLTKVEEFNDIVIATKNGFPIKFKDIGRVEDGGADPRIRCSLDGDPCGCG